ncbi:hypothetical protein O181_067816 [Austropuccinia psidii MF-1]|uniref:Uncharacterized protein n=1 Tax=Austropuccinia psidii MF-1 TaxID=1389203 RepID=A0A9Q3I3F0_9BASI|nr:hypothetical protein [Austropuccinia psidii MF-1]
MITNPDSKSNTNPDSPQRTKELDRSINSNSIISTAPMIEYEAIISNIYALNNLQVMKSINIQFRRSACRILPEESNSRPSSGNTEPQDHRSPPVDESDSQVVLIFSPVLVFGQKKEILIQTKIFNHLASNHLPILRQNLLRLSSVFHNPYIFVKNYLHRVDNKRLFLLIKDLLENIAEIFHQIKLSLNVKYAFQDDECNLQRKDSSDQLMTASSFLCASSKLNNELITSSQNLLEALLSFLNHSFILRQPLRPADKTKFMQIWKSRARLVSQKICFALYDITSLTRDLQLLEYYHRQTLCHELVLDVESTLINIQTYIAKTQQLTTQLDSSSQRHLVIDVQFGTIVEDVQSESDLSDDEGGQIFLTKQAILLAKAAIPILKLSRLIINYFFPFGIQKKLNNHSSGVEFLKNFEHFDDPTNYCYFLHFLDSLYRLVNSLWRNTDDLVIWLNPCKSSFYYNTVTCSFENEYVNILRQKVEKLNAYSTEIAASLAILLCILHDSCSQDLMKGMCCDRDWLDIWCDQLGSYNARFSDLLDGLILF